MSLSVYNKPLGLSRPKTAKDNVLALIPGLVKDEVDENGAPV